MNAHNHALVAQFLKELPEDLPEFAEVSNMSVNTCSHFGNTPLHIAVIRDDAPLVRALIECGADVNAVGEEGYTPLHEACEQGHQKIVGILLANGANRSALNKDGALPHELNEDGNQHRCEPDGQHHRESDGESG